ncbi:hypothetical protein EVAR_63362_1 [Eumeta japonica]|uniref:Uncharacterized protein n=1 Tax=Eumeta variegata TaxID=151549 RepID=A0A4C1ZZC2_EUMVA|nr:hypothetical protein EVAR_63362_1 [Eumeta japonica]
MQPGPATAATSLRNVHKSGVSSQQGFVSTHQSDTSLYSMKRKYSLPSGDPSRSDKRRNDETSHGSSSIHQKADTVKLAAIPPPSVTISVKTLLSSQEDAGIESHERIVLGSSIVSKRKEGARNEES